MTRTSAWLLGGSLLAASLLGAACSTPGAPCSYGGKSYSSGQSFPSLDGCNSCSCLNGAVACTERACAGDLATGDGGADVVMCTADTPVFPSFDRRCATAADCAFDKHQIDCCGSKTAVGFNKAEAARFLAAETTCRSQYPRCRCAERPTTAEDGRSELDGAIAVDCAAGQCRSVIR